MVRRTHPTGLSRLKWVADLLPTVGRFALSAAGGLRWVRLYFRIFRHEAGYTESDNHLLGKNKPHVNLERMPTVLRVGHYRFFFDAGDRNEPSHVERDDKIAKFWLDPVKLHSSDGFKRTEISRIQKLINEHRLQLMKVWDAYFQD